ncbi:MAG: HypC/HybG/HupF family hydrogenase formation chaperone [Euryarchaeota archaeon]|nr:HypC/HybG/HupF family hydrogenase formation chaperone [Euryarchaeota archaeon]
MCLAIPGKVIKKKGNFAKVDFGQGTTREVNISLVDVQVGEYVIVHAGFAIQVLDEEAARETIQLWNEMLSADITST